MIVLKICSLIKVKETETTMKTDCISYHSLKTLTAILFRPERAREEPGESNETAEGLERANNPHVKFTFVENGGREESAASEENFFNDFDHLHGRLPRCKWTDCWRYYPGIFLQATVYHCASLPGGVPNLLCVHQVILIQWPWVYSYSKLTDARLWQHLALTRSIALCYSLEKYRNNAKVNLKDLTWLRHYVIEKSWSGLQIQVLT